jgi:hypothetical protein
LAGGERPGPAPPRAKASGRARAGSGTLQHGSARMAAMPTVEEIRKALEVVIDPELHRSIVELDMVRRIELGADGEVVGDGLADDRRLPDPRPLPERVATP